jgi:hypothetical protein
MAVQGDGKIIAAGSRGSNVPGGDLSPDFALARYWNDEFHFPLRAWLPMIGK